MSDYYSILKQTIADRGAQNAEGRRAVYQLARQRLRSLQDTSNAPHAEIELQRAALEFAIERIELEAKHAVPQPAGQRGQPAEEAPADWADPSPAAARLMRGSRKVGVTWLALAAMTVAIVAVIAVLGVSGYQRWQAARRLEPKDVSSKPPSENASVQNAQPVAASAGSDLPYTLRRQLVYYRTSYPPGTIVIAKSQRFLYFVRPNVAALRYGLAIGRECSDAAGLFRVSQKEANEKLAGRSLGARTLRLDSTDYIHGTDLPKSIGTATSFGCFQLVNDDVVYLYDRADLGTKVVVIN